MHALVDEDRRDDLGHVLERTPLLEQRVVSPQGAELGLVVRTDGLILELFHRLERAPPRVVAARLPDAGRAREREQGHVAAIARTHDDEPAVAPRLGARPGVDRLDVLERVAALLAIVRLLVGEAEA